MKNKKLRIALGSAAGAVVLVIAIVLITGLVKSSQVKTLINQQNYVASKLIELGDYEIGLQLAAETDQKQSNAVSRQLIVLASGFQAEFEEAVAWAESYLAEGSDPVIVETKNLIADQIEAQTAGQPTTSGWGSYEVQMYLTDETRVELLAILLRVQEGINVKKSGANIQAMIEMLSASGGGSSAAMQTISADKSLLAQKIQTVLKLEQNDYEGAYELAEDMFAKDDSFSIRALLANLAATGAIGTENRSEAVDKLYTQRNELYTQLGELQSALNQADSEKKQTRIEQQIAETEAKIDEIDLEISSEPVKRAINFIELKTPVADKKTDAYNMELAYLNYLAGNESKAQQLLVGMMTDTEAGTEPVSILASDLSQTYQENNSSDKSTKLRRLWERVSEILYLIESDRTTRDTSFYEFVLNMLEQLYNGLIIRDIDTSDFPTVRVTVNIASETDRKLKKDDFSVEDMDAQIKKLTLLDMEKVENNDELSVMLVVDRSGSMDGLSMTNTKSAVVNFIRSVDETVDLGLVAFDSGAELLTPLGSSRTELLADVNSLYASGGTSIYSGLKVAGDALTGRGGRKVIILLSDGVDGSGNMIDTVLEELRLKNIYVYTIGITGADSQYLSYIADYCGGKFLRADDSSLLSEIYSSIGEYMANDYVLEFVATQDLEDFSRYLRITTDTLNATSNSEYDVGVSADEIADEALLTPLYDCFRQIGGSAS
ncbi:MAG: VWA domain-containing protein [Clostridia bacterium]|nr:VWA domain-containing protein [Clostridia bacterium]